MQSEDLLTIFCFLKNWSIACLLLSFVLLYFFSPFSSAVTLSYACLFCLSLSPSPFLFSFFFFFFLLSLALFRPLSLRGNLWSVRTPWHSGSGIRVYLLLHDFLKNPSLSAAWYVLCLKVLCRCSWILSLLFLELSTRVSVYSSRMPPITSWRELLALHFLWWLAPFCGGVC